MAQIGVGDPTAGINYLQPFEKEYFTKQGGRVPVLVGVARFEESGNEAVAFVIDLIERKRAEAAARESELRLQDLQMELAHANRVATMGLLTASIAHEVNQPIAALLTNAKTAVRWLDHESLNFPQVKAAVERSIKDDERTADIVRRILDFSKKAPTLNEDFAIKTPIGQAFVGAP